MPKPVTAATVRAWGRTHTDRLSEAAVRSASATRGRVHPDLTKAFNTKRAKARRYVPGVGVTLTAQAKAEAKAQREALRAAGVQVADRGRLPKAALASLKG